MLESYIIELFVAGVIGLIIGFGSLSILPITGYLRLRLSFGVLLVVVSLPFLLVSIFNLFKASIEFELFKTLVWYVVLISWVGAVSAGIEQVLDAKHEYESTNEPAESGEPSGQ